MLIFLVHISNFEINRKSSDRKSVFWTLSLAQLSWILFNSLLPGLKLKWPIFTTALPVPGHERVKKYFTGLLFREKSLKSLIFTKLLTEMQKIGCDALWSTPTTLYKESQKCFKMFVTGINQNGLYYSLLNSNLILNSIWYLTK